MPSWTSTPRREGLCCTPKPGQDARSTRVSTETPHTMRAPSAGKRHSVSPRISRSGGHHSPTTRNELPHTHSVGNLQRVTYYRTIYTAPLGWMKSQKRRRDGTLQELKGHGRSGVKRETTVSTSGKWTHPALGCRHCCPACDTVMQASKKFPWGTGKWYTESLRRSPKTACQSTIISEYNV